MPLITSLINELKHESNGTRKILERIPEEQWDWQPHEKSMKLGKLVNHIVELTNWVPLIITQTEFDIATTTFNRAKATNKKELLELFEQSLAQAIQHLEATTEEALQVKWLFRRGEFVVVNMPRKIVLRQLTMNHIVHHRGQLSVYLRLLNVPVPGLYGPSADEK